MTSTKTGANADVSFKRQFNGYASEQVDQYIYSITKAYQTAYDEYNAVCGKYNGLLEAYKRLEERGKSAPEADVIARTLIKAESLARKIVADANSEAAKITADARADGKRITDEADSRAARTASQAKENQDMAYEIVKRSIEKLQNMLTPETAYADVPQTWKRPALAPLESNRRLSS